MPPDPLVNFDPGRLPTPEREETFHADATYVFEHLSGELIPALISVIDWMQTAIGGDNETIIQGLNDLQTRLNFTPVEQGGPGHSGAKIRIAWVAPGEAHLSVDGTNFGSHWPHNITGNANTANAATHATSAGNADTVDGFHATVFALPNARRVSAGVVAVDASSGWRKAPAGAFISGLYTSPINGVANHHSVRQVEYHAVQVPRADGVWITMVG
jgi:hypothetical protein